MNFAKKQKKAQLNAMATGDGLRRMLVQKDHYAVSTVFPCVASFTVRAKGLEASCDLTQLNVQYIDFVDRTPVDDREVQWVGEDLLELRSKIEELRCAVQRLFAQHCTSGF